MENSSGEGESVDGEGSEIVECTERADGQDEVMVEETGYEEVNHEDDDTNTGANEETETDILTMSNGSQVRVNLDAEWWVYTHIEINIFHYYPIIM